MESPLAVPQAQALIGGEGVVAAQQAAQASPEAGQKREESETQYQGLSGEEAGKLAEEAFPALIDDRAGGPPQLPVGQRLTGFVDGNAAQVELGEGENGIVESTVPMALPAAQGRWAAIDLGLSDAGGTFKLANPLVEVAIPKHLAEGAQLGQSGVSLTPVDGSGAALGGGEGAIEGSVAFYANTQTDTDTVLKPTTFGFDAIAMLRSVQSPQQLDYKIGLPEGASLAQEGPAGAVRVLKEGTTIATVATPSARDAAGAVVPVKMSVAGDILSVSVDQHAGSYLYPIAVDPEVFNTTSESLALGNWHPSAGAGYTLTASKGSSQNLYISHLGSYAENDLAYWAMTTNGDSKIYKVAVGGVTFWPEYGEAEHKENTYPSLRAWLEILHEGSESHSQVLSGTPYLKAAELCANGECSAAGVAGGNGVLFATISTESSKFYEERGESYNVPFGGFLGSATTYIAQPKETHSTIGYNTSTATLAGTPNVFYGSGRWFGPNSGAFEFTANDKGLGVAATKVELEGKSGWSALHSRSYLSEEAFCKGTQCSENESETDTYHSSGLSALPNGEDRLRVAADDAEPNTWSSEHGEGVATIKVDATSPHGLTLTGLSGKGEEFELGEVEAHVKVEASDGEGSVLSSGIQSLALGVNGKEIGKPSGACSPGPCTATGEWSINGAELGAGTYKLTMVATDHAGNVASKEYVLSVYHASPVGMGPGSVNPESGDFALEASDVGVSGGSGSLAVTRHYDSRNVKEGEEGPLGPQWTLSLGSLASLEVLPGGSVMVVGPGGLTYFNAKKEGGFEAPAGDSNLTLEYEPKEKEYLLKDLAKDTTTGFTLPTGARTWMPTVSKGPVATDTVTDAYETVEVEAGKNIVEPTLELAPHPAASCEPAKLEKGCRALKFAYGTETTAKGESESQWGEYKNRLKEVSAVAYNPSTKAVETKPVAAYEYDQQGRLRAEWDPRVSPVLKTIYGYDPEGHVTAMTSAGQQPWFFSYGSTTGDTSGGRLVALTRAPASAGAWGGEAPVNTEIPKLSTSSPVEGTELTVSTGLWSNSPGAYAYQWERCNASGGECSPIPGATDPGYTVRYGKDEGSKLEVQVSATNAGGSAIVTSAATAVVPATVPTPVYSTAFGSLGSGEGQFKSPEYIALGKSYLETSGSHEVAYVTDTGDNRVEMFSLAGKSLAAFGSTGSGNGQFSEPTGIAAGEFESEYGENGKENVLVADSGNKRIERFYDGSFYFSSGADETAGALGGISFGSWFPELDVANRGASEVEKTEVAYTKVEHRGHVGSVGTENGKFKEPADVAWNPVNKDWYVLDTGNDRVQYFTTGWLYQGQFGKVGSSNGQFKEPKGIAVDTHGDVWVVDSGNNRVQELSSTGSYLTQFGSSGSTEGKLKAPMGILVAPSGNIYVVDTGNNRVEVWVPGKLPSEPPLPPAKAPSLGASAVSTIEYGVPLEGAEAPQQMGLNGEGKAEPGKWGQRDDPVYATAIFPPDKPMGWPAKEYTRATTYYMDDQARTVNVVLPTGGISTAEYNEDNEVDRSLSPDNRALALKEATEEKSIEASQNLDTQSTYNSEGELREVKGPQHTVKLVSGEKAGLEVLARNHVVYSYNQGAPAGEAYDLVTTTTDSAQISGKGEYDPRTTSTAYNGQSNLGWKLRQPTSVTTDPGGLKLTSTTKYEESTGNVIETQSPAASGGDASVPAVFASQFGSTGSGNGQFKEPKAEVVTSSGSIDVLDSGNSRVQEFSAAGVYQAKFGSWGTGNGQLESPSAMAGDSKGNLWVADTGNNRIEEFNAKGEYVAKFGSEGTAGGQFKEPRGIAIGPGALGKIYVADTANDRIEIFSKEGEFLEAFGFGVSNGESKFERCTSACHAGIAGAGVGQLNLPRGLAVSQEESIWVADTANNRIQGFNSFSEHFVTLGSVGSGNGQFKEPKGIAVDARGNILVADSGNDRVQKFTPLGVFLAVFGGKGAGTGQFETPWGVTPTASGNVYVADVQNNRVQQWAPRVAGSAGAQETKTIFYTSAANSEYPACGGHIEWAGLPCQTRPVAQTGIGGLPELPVTTITYNMWDQAETTTEVFGSTTRTKKTTFDSVGRPLSTEVTSSIDEPLPKVTDTYSKTSGALETQSTTSGGTTETITSAYDSLGQLESYTDADGNTAKYVYDVDGRVTKVSDSSDKGGSEQAYSYSETTGALSKLVDSAAQTFTASYDVQGKMTSESYPNGMTAYYTYDPAGTATGLEYKKLTHCTEKCVWFNDTIVPSIHGETLKQASTLSEEPNYTYDNAGRLTEVQEQPAGEGCTTRSYTYDEDSNRTSLTTRSPGSEGKCASEGGSTEWHTYSTADQLTDTGIAYEPFGNTTSLPAADAGGSELTSKYYVDSQIYQQSQGGEKLEYKLDPEDRTRETIATGTTESQVISHYDAPGSALAWTSEPGEKWTRNIPGIGGELAAVQSNPGSVVLELHDLQGNIVATAALSETETKLLSKYNSTEFGVPSGKGEPPKYAWLGSDALASELPSGAITQDGSTYVPQIGRPLQTQGIQTGTPVNGGTPFTSSIAPWVAQAAGAAGAHQVALAHQEREALEEADMPAGVAPQPEEEGESIVGYLPFEHEGGGAHAAGHIECGVAEGNGLPHESSHTPGFVNWTILFECNAPVLDVRVRLALFWEGEEVSETGYVEVGTTAYWKESVQTPCISGWYTGWVYVDLEPPPGYKGERVFKSWSKASQYVKCKS